MQHQIYPSLYILRLFAAMCVVLAHANSGMLLFEEYSSFISNIQFLPSIGMSLFFCLSGFIIHIIYHDYQRQPSTINHWRKFYVARFARIYPLYFFLLLIHIFTVSNELFSLLSLKENILLFSSWLTMTQSWYYFPIQGANMPALIVFGIAWSLSTEVFFYMVYPLICYAITKLSYPKAVVRFVCFIIISHIMLYSGYTYLISQNLVDYYGDNFYHSPVRWLIYISPYVRILDFITGCIAAQIYLSLPSEYKDKCLPYTWPVLISCLLAIVYIFTNMRIDNSQANHTYYWFLHMNYGATPFIAVIILYSTNLFKFKENNIVINAILLGEASYCLYLVHDLFFARLFGRLLFETMNAYTLFQWASIMILTILFSIIVSVGFFTYFESPIRKMIKSTLSK